MANKSFAMSQFVTVDVENVSDSSSEWEVVDQSDEEQDTYSFDGISDSGSDSDSVVADREISAGAVVKEVVVAEDEAAEDGSADVDGQDRESEISFGSPSDQVHVSKMDMVRRYISVDHAAVFAPMVKPTGGSADMRGQIPFGSPTDDVYVPPVASSEPVDQRWRTVGVDFHARKLPAPIRRPPPPSSAPPSGVSVLNRFAALQDDDDDKVGVFNKAADVESQAPKLPAPIGRPAVTSSAPREPLSSVGIVNRFDALQDDDVEAEEYVEEEEDDYGMDVDDELVPTWVMAKFERQRLKKSVKKSFSKTKKVKKLPYYHNKPGCAMVWA